MKSLVICSHEMMVIILLTVSSQNIGRFFCFEQSREEPTLNVRHEIWNSIELLGGATAAPGGGDGDYRVQKFTFPFLKAGAFRTALSHCCGTFSSSILCTTL